MLNIRQKIKNKSKNKKLNKYFVKRQNDAMRKMFRLKSIEKDYILLTDGTCKRILSFNTHNHLIMNESQLKTLHNNMEQAILQFDNEILIKSINMNMDLSTQIEYYTKMLQNNDFTDYEFDFINQQINNMEITHDNQNFPNKGFLFIYDIELEPKFLDRERYFISSLKNCGEVQKLSDEVLKVMIFKDLNIFTKNASTINDEGTYINSEVLNDLDDTYLNTHTEAIFNKITPNSIYFNEEQVQVNDTKTSLYGLVGGKSYISFGNLFKISSNLNIDSCIYITSEYKTAGMLKKERDKLEQEIEYAYKKRRNISEIRDLELLRDDLITGIDSIQNSGDKLISCNVFFRFNTQEEDFKKSFRDMKTQVENLGFILENIRHKQQEAYLFTSIFNIYTSTFRRSKFDIVLSSGSIVNLYPFINRTNSSSKKAIPFSYQRNGIMCLDLIPDIINLGAMNNNMMIFGGSGAGKTTLLKKIIFLEVIKGTKTFLIDPESEFSLFGKNLNAKIIKPNGNIINPLQPKVLEYFDDNGKLCKTKISDFYVNIIAFLKCIKEDFNDDIIADVLNTMYASKNITDDTDLTTLNNQDYPIFTDLFKALFLKMYSLDDYDDYMKSVDKNFSKYVRLSKATEQSQHEFEQQLYFIQSFLPGNLYGRFFNGTTTVDLDGDDKLFIFDINSILLMKNDRLSAGMYFNILNFIEYSSTKNKTEQTIVVLDEAHLLYRAKQKFILQILSEFSKRLRKNKSCIVQATQDITDITAKEIKDLTATIMSNAPVKVFMKMDEKQTIELKKIYASLTKEEIEVIETCGKGQGIMQIGNNKIVLDLIFNQKELELLKYNPEVQERNRLIEYCNDRGIDITQITFIDNIETQIIELKNAIESVDDSKIIANLRKQVKELTNKNLRVG